jgi:hypothetical protein
VVAEERKMDARGAEERKMDAGEAGEGDGGGAEARQRTEPYAR